MKDKVIRVQLDRALKARLKRVAAARGCDSSDVTLEALIEKVKEAELRLNISPVPQKALLHEEA